jgi:hypothetical protein
MTPPRILEEAGNLIFASRAFSFLSTPERYHHYQSFVIVAYAMIARAAPCFGLANMFRLAPLLLLIEDHQPCVKKGQ